MSVKYLFVLCLTLLDATSSGNHSTGELRIVLLGKSGAGKSATGNTILGREEAFREDLSFESVTSSSSEKSGEVSGRKVLVVDTPGLYDTSKTEEELKREIERCVNLSVPGPHVFLLVIRLGVRFTEEEENAVKWIQANFGQRASLFTMVLFTHADELHGKPLESILHGGLRTLIESCGGGCHAFDNAERDDKTQVEELLQKIDAMVRRNRGEHYTNWMYQKAQREMREEEVSGELRIVLVGKSGSGKSATGNTILQREEAFAEEMNFNSVTSASRQESAIVDGRNVTIVDTPGLFDTKKTAEELKSEIEKCVNLSVPGPHVFLLVIRVDVRFTAEEENAVKWIQNNFGERAAQFTMVLFTRADSLKGKTLEAIFNDKILHLIGNCSGQYHAFNNKEKDDKTQVMELLQKIDIMVKENEGMHYTNAMYQEVQRKMREEEEKRRQEEENRKEEHYEKIRKEERDRWDREQEEKQAKRDKRRLVCGTIGAVAGAALGLAYSLFAGPVGFIGGAFTGDKLSEELCYWAA
ncbi:GTPase IMAP family member 8-like [Engraulis encrasicolus]|uniref:GTPase IMAP family member 8-like n=1 Tax=Engraulis encrasicolus TaxID=184585 RepID=UPI002FD6099F